MFVALEILYKYSTIVRVKQGITELNIEMLLPKRFYYHQQTKAYANKELESYRETLSQTGISLSSKGILDLNHSNGQIDSASILDKSSASSSILIEHQPPKLGGEGSNLSRGHCL